MSDEEVKEGGEGEGGEVQPVQDQTEILLRKVAALLAEKSVNYAIIVNDGASPRWIVSDVYWALGVFQLINRRIEHDWDVNMFEDEEEDDEEDE